MHIASLYPLARHFIFFPFAFSFPYSVFDLLVGLHIVTAVMYIPQRYLNPTHVM